MKKKNNLGDYLHILELAVEERRFTAKTLKKFKRIISLRLDGAALWLIANRLKISGVRVHAIEKEFLEMLDEKQSKIYKSQVRSAKMTLRRRVSRFI